RVVPAAGRRRDDRAGGLRRSEEDDLDDLGSVDGVRERFLELEVEKLSVLLLLRVRVEDEVGLVESWNVGDREAGVLQRLDRGRRNGLDRVDLMGLERGDHRIVVRE